MVPAIIIFAIAYVLMLTFSRFRPFIALGGAVLFIALGMLPISEIFNTIDFNVILMIAGTMGIVALFIESKMPEFLADLIMEKMPNVMWSAVALSLFAGIISAFVDNVATVLMVAPIALEVCKKLKTNAVPFIIAIAVSSNLQGAATLVGDTTAIMLGSANDMTFFDFFWFKGKPSIFFAVELGAVLSALILAYLFRKERAPIPKIFTRTKVLDYVPTVLLVGTILLLVVGSFVTIPVRFVNDNLNGLICVFVLFIGLIYNLAKKKTIAAITEPLKSIDFETIGLLLGLFLMIGAIENQGVIKALADLIAGLGGGNIFLVYTIIVWGSVLISAFVDNIPYVATMITVIPGLAVALGLKDPTLLYFGLLSGATLGGNCTPIGASANITGIGILRKGGFTVKNSDFFKIGIPFTLAAIVPAYIYIWFVYGI